MENFWLCCHLDSWNLLIDTLMADGEFWIHFKDPQMEKVFPAFISLSPVFKRRWYLWMFYLHFSSAGLLGSLVLLGSNACLASNGAARTKRQCCSLHRACSHAQHRTKQMEGSLNPCSSASDTSWTKSLFWKDLTSLRVDGFTENAGICTSNSALVSLRPV